MRGAMAALGLMLALMQAAPLDDTATARKKYDALAVRVTGGDMTVDWRELRLASIVAGVNGDFDWHDQDKKFQTAFNAGNYDEALKLALSITGHNIASLNGHFDAFVAYKRLDKTAEAEKESNILNALLRSIAASGDGKSAATAWFTVDPSEEYIFLGLAVGMTGYPDQALAHKDGHDYDEMTVTGKDGQKTTYWFNTDTDMQMMKRSFGKK